MTRKLLSAVALAVMLAVLLVGCASCSADSSGMAQHKAEMKKLFNSEENIMDQIDQLVLHKDTVNKLVIGIVNQGTGFVTAHTIKDKALIARWIDFLSSLDLEKQDRVLLYGSSGILFSFFSPKYKSGFGVESAGLDVRLYNDDEFMYVADNAREEFSGLIQDSLDLEIEVP